MNNEAVKRNLQPRWIVLALFLIATVIAVIFYFNRAQKEFAEGMAAYNATDLLTANQHFQRITGFYRWASPANASQAQTLMDTEIRLLLSAQEKRAHGDFEATLMDYDSFLRSYPTSIQAESVKIHMADTYVEWGDTLTQSSNYEEAIKKYSVILNDYKTQAVAQDAVTQISAAHLKWGDTLAQSADYQGAIKQYLKVLILDEYKDQPPASAAYQGILTIGQQLIAKKSFVTAMEMFTIVNALTNNSKQQAQLEAGYQSAFLGLAVDKGADGQRIITEALQQACNGKPAISPIVGTSQNQPAQVGMCEEEYGIALPEEWQATTPGSLKYAIAVNSSESVVGSCQYVNSLSPNIVVATTKLIMPIETISIYDATTGAIVNQQKVPGTSPGECMESFGFGTPQDRTGGDPSPEAIQEAIMDLISPLIVNIDAASSANSAPPIPVLNPGSILPLSYTLLKGHKDSITSVAFSPDGTLLASGSVFDDTVRLWNVATGTKVRTLEEPSDTTLTSNVIFSPDGTLLAWGSQEMKGSDLKGVVELWDVTNGTQVRTLGNMIEINLIDFSPDGKWLVVAGTPAILEREVQVWNVASGAQAQTLGKAEWVDSIAFSPDGKWLATAWTEDGWHRTIKLWDAERMVEVRTLGNEMNMIDDIAFSPDGKWLAAAGTPDDINNTVWVWDVTNGAEIHTLNDLDSITSIAFSSDGKSLAILEKNTTKLWQIDKELKPYALENPENRRYTALFQHGANIIFSPDGKWLAAISEEIVELRELWTVQEH